MGSIRSWKTGPWKTGPWKTDPWKTDPWKTEQIRMRSSGNTVLITGGATGIGLALARRLILNDNTVIVCSRDRAKLDAACSDLPTLITLHCDVADADSRRALVAGLAERFPGLNVLVNNAGLLHVSDPTGPGLVQELEAEVATNLVAPVALANLLLPAFRRQPSATIVNVTTGYVFLPSAQAASYSATKAALHVMTRTLRFQLRSTSIRVVEVMPPAVDTAMARHHAGRKASPASIADRILKGLVRDEDEIVIGISRLGRLLSRAVPRTGFHLMNRSEAKQARSTDT